VREKRRHQAPAVVTFPPGYKELSKRADPTTPGVLHPALEPSAQTWTCWSGARGGHKKII